MLSIYIVVWVVLLKIGSILEYFGVPSWGLDKILLNSNHTNSLRLSHAMKLKDHFKTYYWESQIMKDFHATTEFKVEHTMTRCGKSGKSLMVDVEPLPPLQAIFEVHHMT